ncbi:DUF1054 family protein, partial [Bacillus pumilus]
MRDRRFRDEDFETFTADGLDERMTVLKERVRPKLEALGEPVSYTHLRAHETVSN